MNNITQEALMKIIGELDRSHKKENANLRLENRCLKNLMNKNETEHTMKMIDHCVCHDCEETVYDYTHYLSEAFGGGEEYIETEENIHKCVICKNNFCKDCVWWTYKDGKLLDFMCNGCNEIRKKTEEIRKLVLLMDNSNN